MHALATQRAGVERDRGTIDLVLEWGPPGNVERCGIFALFVDGRREWMRRAWWCAVAGVLLSGGTIVVPANDPIRAIESDDSLTGENAPDWAALVRIDLGDEAAYCSGSLITPTRVLTAAHCVLDDTGTALPAAAFSVVVGRGDLADTSDGVERAAVSVLAHPGYDPTDVAVHDLALITIEAVPSDYDILPISREHPVDVPGVMLVGYGTEATNGDGERGTLPDGSSLVLRSTNAGEYTTSRCDALSPIGEVFGACAEQQTAIDGAFAGDSGAPWVARVHGRWQQFLVQSSSGPGVEYATGVAGTVETAETLFHGGNFAWIRVNTQPNMFVVGRGGILRDPVSGRTWAIDRTGMRRPILDPVVGACLVKRAFDTLSRPMQQIMQIPELADMPATCDEPVCGNVATTTDAGLTNIGFETGDLTGWQSVGSPANCAVTADHFVEPYEGEHMGRVAFITWNASIAAETSATSTLTQTFIADTAHETFVYNVVTESGHTSDSFGYEVTAATATGDVTVASYQRSKWWWGASTQPTGWQYVDLDLADHVGEEITVTFTVARYGYRTWVYLDSAESGPPPVVRTPMTTATSATGTTVTDLESGIPHVFMPVGNRSDLTITSTLSCYDGPIVTRAEVSTGDSDEATSVEMTHVPGTPSTYTATIPADRLDEDWVTVDTHCGYGYSTTGILAVTFVNPAGPLPPFEISYLRLLDRNLKLTGKLPFDPPCTRPVYLTVESKGVTVERSVLSGRTCVSTGSGPGWSVTIRRDTRTRRFTATVRFTGPPLPRSPLPIALRIGTDTFRFNADLTIRDGAYKLMPKYITGESVPSAM